MDNLFMCSICGLCRYNHDVFRAPRISSVARINLWTQEIGEEAMRRLLKTTHAFVCIEHFNYAQSFDSHGKLKANARPLKLSDAELQSQENLFHDHKFYHLQTRRFSPELTLDTVCCSLCSQLVSRTDMNSHAEIHTPPFMNLMDYLCDFHSKQPTYNFYPSECEDCTNMQSRAAFELARKEAERCFPMFHFKIIQNDQDRFFTFTIESELRDEYVKPRQNREEQEIPEVPKAPEVKNEHHEEIPDFDQLEKLEKLEQMENDLENSDSVSDESPPPSDEKDPDYVPDDSPDSNNNEEMECEELTEDDQLSPLDKKLTLNDYYQEDRHPSFEKLIQICEHTHSSSYFATTFNFFRIKRLMTGEPCVGNDVCERVEKLLEIDGRPFPQVLIDFDTMKKMEEEFEKHAATGKKFYTGYVFRIADKLKVHPDILRAEYRRFQKSYNVKRAKERRIQHFEEIHHGLQDENLTTTHVALRVQPYAKRYPTELIQKLEEEYLRLGGVEHEWPKFACRDIGKKLGLTTMQVKQWMGRRKRKGDGKLERRHTFSPEETELLLEAFEENPHPTDYKELAARLNLTHAQVSNFFDTHRTAVRKETELKGLRAELDALTEEQLAELKQHAEENPHLLMDDRIELAEHLGLSYQLVTHWLELHKKGHVVKRRSLRKRSRPARFLEEESDELMNEEDEISDDEVHPKHDDTHDEMGDEVFHSDYSEEF